MDKPKAILFDWDNTLADTWPTIYAAMRNTFIDMGQEPWSFEETKERVHRSMRDYFPQIFGEDKWEEASERYMHHFRTTHLDNLLPLEGAEDVLKELMKHEDIYVALVSNKTGSNLRKEVEHIGWNKYFRKVIGAKDAEEDKPSIKPVLMALEGSGIEPGDHVWFIGDSITDLECAYNSNCLPLFYGDQDLSHSRFINYQPHRHFKGHDELLEVLKGF